MSAKRASLIRWLRNAAIVCGIVASVVFLVLWMRSYTVAERLHGRISERHLFLLASKQGRVIAIAFPPSFHRNHWKWEVRRYPVKSKLGFPSGDVRRHESALGFGLMRDPMYSLDQLFAPPRIEAGSPFEHSFESRSDDDSRVFVSYASFVTLRGTGVVVPYWFLVSLGSAVAFALWVRRPWRYSMNQLFVVVTLVAVLLGLVSAMDN